MMNMNINAPHFIPNRVNTPQPPILDEEASSSLETDPDLSFLPSDFSIMHFNCQNSIQITHEALTMTHFTLLALQEPWFNTHSLSFPYHDAWHRLTAYDYNPSAWSDRPRVCFYLSKNIPTANFSILPSSSDIILALDLRCSFSDQVRLRIITWYNPPGTMRGFLTLKHWMYNHHKRHIPTILVADTNLHHHIWNPPGYNITDPMAKRLLQFFSNIGFKLSSPKGVPTRFSSNTQPTTIDLIWSSWNLSRKIKTCKVITDSLSSDHLPVATILDLSIAPELLTHSSFNLDKLDHELLHETIRSKLHLLPLVYSNQEDIESAVETLSNIILEAAQNQGKTVITRWSRYKCWWDKARLDPILKNRNRARKWMLKSGLPEAQTCYKEWQHFFKRQVISCKADHWKKFLANCSNKNTFKAFKYVKPSSTSEVAPLKNHIGQVVTEKEDQASLLFHGTSVAHAEADLSDIPPDFINESQINAFLFPPLESPELRRTINRLPNRKARGGDGIPNELIKISLPAIEDELCRLFNGCFEQGFFPKTWRKAVTIIIRKSGKDDYSNPNAYRPIALLSCLGKILEKIITSRLTFWAESMKVIAPGHMGGRCNHPTDDALLILTTWIKEKWRKGEVVSALSLDVKSAYPSVHQRRLLFTLFQHNCPLYLRSLIKGFLSERSTNLKLQDYLSISFDCEDGLPQGSPLSVILYIIYNSPLLNHISPSPDGKELSLGFIDDVIHVVASKTFEENINKLQIYASTSLDWASTHGAIFDRKKAQLIHFTNKRKIQSLPTLIFGDVILTPKQEIKWLGVWFDSKLLFNSHLHHVKKIGEFTLHQLRRISKCFSGLSPKETKRLISTVLLPRIFYGSLVWFTRKNFSKVNKIISSIQNSAILLTLGFFRGSSIDLIYHDSYSIPFHLSITKRHHGFYLKRLTAPDSHPTRLFIEKELNLSTTKLKSPIQDMLRIEDFRNLIGAEMETIYPHTFPPWSNFCFRLHNLDISKEVAKSVIPGQVEEALSKGSVVIFTDGSASPEGGGAAAVSTSSYKTISIDKRSIFSNHETELMGILLAAKLAKVQIRKSQTINPEVTIFSDNQGVLRLMQDIPRATSGQHLIIKTMTLLRQLPTSSPINLCWTPGHVGIALNEEADQLAKQAAVDQQKITRLPASLGSLKKKVKESVHPNLYPFRPGSKAFSTNPKDIADALMNMEKGRAAVISQLRADHSPLNDHLYKRNLIDSPLCTTCGVRETTNHFLLYCSKYKKAQRVFRKQLRKENIKLNWNNTLKILDSPKAFPLLSSFILNTQRFVFFHSYSQDIPNKKQIRGKRVVRRRRLARST